MRNLWIKFGCFLTGYNYGIVRNSSEVAAKAVKRYTAALVIVCILWAFVGYTFTQRYLEGSLYGCIAGSIVAIVIIVQIERQIILSINPNIGLYIFRGCLALMMALLGAVVIDQIILKKDIDLEKISYVENRVDSLLPKRTKELQQIIFAIDTTIKSKEAERQSIIDDISKTPLIKSISSFTQNVPVINTRKDSSGDVISTTSFKSSTSFAVTNVANPKQALLAPLDSSISQLRAEKVTRQNTLLTIRPDLVKDITSKVGFLDELKVMYGLISKSNVALAFWLLWLFFLLFLEMLVLFSKIGDKENDYEKTIKHQMYLQMHKLDVLAKQAVKN